MWTRAPAITSCVDCLALDHEEEVGAASPRFHHRGSSSSSNHQPGERESKRPQHTQPTAVATALKPESAAALDHFLTLGSESTTLHHDLPKPPGTSKRSLPRGMPFFTETSLEHYPMSTPERASIVAMLRPATGTSSYDVGCVRKDDKPQLDDMRTQIIILANAHTPASSDQEVPEVVLPSPSSKRRRLVYNHETELNRPPAEAPSSEGCEDSGLTGEQHMADLDRTSKGSTPEDIDSATAAPATELLAPVLQCRSTSPRNQWVLAPEQENVIDPVLPEPLQIFERLHFSSTQLVPGRTSSPRDDDSHFITSQFLPPAGHIRVSDYRISDTTRTMASSRDEWLQLSLGSRGPSDDEPLAPVLYQQSSMVNPPRSITPDPPGIRDFFKFGAETQEASSSLRHDAAASPFGPGQSAHYGPHYSGESSKQHYNPPEPRSAVFSRPLFVEPLPRATRDFDPYVHNSRILPDQLKSSFTPQQFSNLASSPYHPVRALQPVRSEQTDTTAVHEWRSSAHEAGPSSGPHYNYASSAPWMQQQQQQQQRQDTQRTSPNPVEFLTMGTRDWRSGTSFSSMQPPMAHGVDPEQAWRNLLQRVGSTTNVPVGASMSSAIPRHPESMTMVPSVEYLDALKRAVERFQGADQGGKEEPLAEVQRLHRSAALFSQPRHHPAGLPFDSSPDIGLARLSTAPGSSKPRAQAAAGPGPSSESRQRRILRPHAPRPGLWFTLLASNSQPEASPLQQIPTAYIRVVDDTMTVAVVRRYLANKLGMASEDEVELTCKGQPLPPSLSLHQVRDGIWQSANTNAPNPNTPQLLSEGKAWKAPDGSITLVGDVVMVITYGRRPQLQQQAPPPPTST